MKYWVNTISRDHVMRGMAGSFTQANHGKKTKLALLDRDDWIIFYSPKADYEGTEALQAFTAIAQVDDDEAYQFAMSPGFEPWRRNLRFFECRELPIRSLIDYLSFIKDKTHWGYMFRFGLFEIPENDFKLIQKLVQ